ncbi:GlxA family transcriptional regulator [Sphingomonas sp.]|uniref:GlxA family transcriptional regulator n=1 Tax=Sphingomonas sp. TaxID=28214 RepID=UPI0035C79D94
MPISDAQAEIHLGLLLIDDYALLSYASLIEPFRAANALGGQARYRWTHFSVDGGPVAASNGVMVLADRRVGEDASCDLLFVVAGGDPRRFADTATFAWLRRLASLGTALGGVSGGPYLLARAGLLDGHRATVHWEHADLLRDGFPRVALEGGLYVIDRQRMTCAGGTAGLDLAIALIGRDHGPDLALRVGEWFIRTDARGPDRSQRASPADRFGVHDARLLRALAAMEGALEEPLGPESLAITAGLSRRQLERLFQRLLGTGIGEAYLRLRLDHARHLLRATGLSVTDVAVASGFASASHFSRVFKARFGIAPRDARPSAMDQKRADIAATLR